MTSNRRDFLRGLVGGAAGAVATAAVAKTGNSEPATAHAGPLASLNGESVVVIGSTTSPHEVGLCYTSTGIYDPTFNR